MAVLPPLILSGCQPAMSTPAHRDPPERVHTGQPPLTFDSHNFGVACYDTYGCSVFYNNRYVTKQPENELRRSSASVGRDYLQNLRGTYIDIANFPPPAVVTWRSKDGEAHEARIDFSEIFKDQAILHNVAATDLATDVDTVVGAPDIVLEVNDRTINVYMRAFINTRSPQNTGNSRSYSRDELVLAYSRTY